MKTPFLLLIAAAVFLLNHFLPLLKKPIAATFLVAPWFNYHWHPEGWKQIDSFHQKPFYWENIKKGSKYFEIYQSINDDTPVEEGRELAQKLNAKLVIVKNAGHFNTKSGYTTFPLLLKNIISVTKSVGTP